MSFQFGRHMALERFSLLLQALAPAARGFAAASGVAQAGVAETFLLKEMVPGENYKLLLASVPQMLQSFSSLELVNQALEVMGRKTMSLQLRATISLVPLCLAALGWVSTGSIRSKVVTVQKSLGNISQIAAADSSAVFGLWSQKSFAVGALLAFVPRLLDRFLSPKEPFVDEFLSVNYLRTAMGLAFGNCSTRAAIVPAAAMLSAKI
jgi:hypothetical protein